MGWIKTYSNKRSATITSVVEVNCVSKLKSIPIFDSYKKSQILIRGLLCIWQYFKVMLILKLIKVIIVINIKYFRQNPAYNYPASSSFTRSFSSLLALKIIIHYLNRSIRKSFVFIIIIRCKIIYFFNTFCID